MGVGSAGTSKKSLLLPCSGAWNALLSYMQLVMAEVGIFTVRGGHSNELHIPPGTLQHDCCLAKGSEVVALDGTPPVGLDDQSSLLPAHLSVLLACCVATPQRLHTIANAALEN